jgi:hypothetical protein
LGNGVGAVVEDGALRAQRVCGMTKSDRHLAQFISRGSAIRSFDCHKIQEVLANMALLYFFPCCIYLRMLHYLPSNFNECQAVTLSPRNMTAT